MFFSFTNQYSTGETENLKSNIFWAQHKELYEILNIYKILTNQETWYQYFYAQRNNHQLFHYIKSIVILSGSSLIEEKDLL